MTKTMTTDEAVSAASHSIADTLHKLKEHFSRKAEKIEQDISAQIVDTLRLADAAREPARIRIRTYSNGQAEVLLDGKPVGVWEDAISAVAAACEEIVMRSSQFGSARSLPERLIIEVDSKERMPIQTAESFTRRIVCREGAWHHKPGWHPSSLVRKEVQS